MSRLARPRLREPGLTEWARLLAGQSGLSFGLSPAGRRAETLRQLWGGREGLVESMTGTSLGTLRDGADALAARGVVRRGLVLGCSTCGRPSFITVTNLAQVNPCPRCGTVNELAQKQWRDPVEELSWYYDLHPVARELLTDHGEIPLLLSRHLRSATRQYDDAPELELREASRKSAARSPGTHG